MFFIDESDKTYIDNLAGALHAQERANREGNTHLSQLFSERVDAQAVEVMGRFRKSNTRSFDGNETVSDDVIKRLLQEIKVSAPSRAESDLIINISDQDLARVLRNAESKCISATR